MRGYLWVAAIVLTLCAPLAGAQSVTMQSLLREMTSLDWLAVAPGPAYITKQFSSYDRNSTDPNVLTEKNWFANGDRGQYLRKEKGAAGEEFVLMDADGPGAIVRFWSANANDGGIARIYIDGVEKPAVEVSLEQMLDGRVQPFVKPIAVSLSKGWSSYLPIPYARHCKVTVSKFDIYYQINYRTYASGTVVEPYTSKLAERLMPLIESTAKALEAPDTAAKLPENAVPTDYQGSLAPGETQSLELVGPAAVHEIICKIGGGDDLAEVLRGCLLEIAFDGNAPSVIAPVGDFFGTAPGLNPFKSLSCGVINNGKMYSHWVMPFQQKAVLSVTNHSKAAVTLCGAVTTAPWTWKPDSLYFHAKWRGVRDLPTRPMLDWNYMSADGGRGRFAGVMLHITNPVGDWWGEGDEKIYVDGENFPSHFGTGTEDYFGYAWCSNEKFTHAYHNQPRCDGPGNYGQTCVSRFHIMDNIPWTKSFRFDLEMWHWADVKIAQSVCAYWYADGAAKDNFPVLDPALLSVPPVPEMKGVEGALEAEKMKVVSADGGEASPQGGAARWSLMEQIWWRHGKVGDKLVLAFPVAEAGRYEVLASFTKAPDYGIHKLTVNGQPVKEPLDLYHTKVLAEDEQSLGVFDLVQGDNKLEVEVVGANEKAKPGNMFGLDYLRLIKK